jgi:hypothetical protein
MQTTERRVVLLLRLMPDHRVEGRLEPDGGATHAFFGWLELVAALERVLEPDSQDRDGGNHETDSSC